MRDDAHLSGVEILIGAICLANICLLVAAAFWGRPKATDNFDSREKVGWAAVFFGLSSQIFYFLMEPGMLGWFFLNRDSMFHQLHVRFFSVGFALSVVALFLAFFARGMRRYASLWVAVTSGILWMMTGLNFLLTAP